MNTQKARGMLMCLQFQMVCVDAMCWGKRGSAAWERFGV